MKVAETVGNNLTWKKPHRTQNNMTLDLVMTDTDELIAGLEGSGCPDWLTWFCLFWAKKKAVLSHLSVLIHRVNFSKDESRRGIQIGRNNLGKMWENIVSSSERVYHRWQVTVQTEETGLATSPLWFSGKWETKELQMTTGSEGGH